MVDYRKDGNVAILEVNYPPVNALGQKTRTGISEGLKRANADDAIKAIVLTGKGKTFPAGADITEFSKGKFHSGLTLTEVCAELEGSRKPVVAAVHGTALGGGCEIAISCHYRVVLNTARFGFPEVALGILPAASGTQRFPRVAGLEAALDIIPSGRQFTAKKAQQFGMVDKLVSGNLVQEAVTFARSVAGRPLEQRRVSRQPVKGAEKAHALQDAAMAKVQKKQKGLQAPIFCVKSVMASLLPFDQGIEKETELAMVLFASGQARALQYAFFAQRAATKWELPGGASHKTVRPKQVKTGAVIGAGTMGTGIAMTMMNAGMPVVLVEQNQKFLDKGVALLKNLYAGSVKVGVLTEAQAKKIFTLLSTSLSYDALKDVDIVIEAVYEHMTVKKEIFAKLDKVCKPGAILATNTSSLSIDEIASATKRPESVIGTHFFVPAYYMQLLENVRGKLTSPEVIATAQAFGQQIKKVPVSVGNCRGFVGNRMLRPYSLEANFLLEEGASIEEIDQTLEDFGMSIGPFKVSDLSGLDIGWAQRKEIAKDRGIKDFSQRRFIDGMRYSPLADALCELGRFGRKTGSGWYKYEKPGAKEPMVDPYVKTLVGNYQREHGIVPRRISQQEIVERCLYGLINEGFKILEEGIASKPEDIDTIWLLGYAWPRQTGGPMYYANTVGVRQVYDRICHYYAEHPTSIHWQPSELLKKVAGYNAPMQGWTQHIASRL